MGEKWGLHDREVVASQDPARGVGRVIRWEPFLASMCDALVRFDDGFECWYASSSLRPAPGDLRPLPDRQKVIADNDARTLASLQAIRAQHVRDFARPWPGAEHGKAIVGKAIDEAIADVRRRKG